MPLITRAARRPSLPGAHRLARFDSAVAEFFMRIALEEAARGLGRTSPNPVVGAILVKGGRVIARGYHRKAGSAHAEVVALEAAGPRARGADLYTTLEPCDHWGRTPPCSLAIIEAGVRRVVCGSADPNPLVDGKGVQRLRKAGVEVLQHVLREEADALNRPFFKVMRTGLPYVTLKVASTLDGKLATASGDSRWVTGEAARERVHHLRDQVDAILVGARTVEKDDPQLTTRLPGGEGKDPVRVVLDSHLRLPLRQRVFTQHSAARTILCTLESPEGRKARRLVGQGVEVWQVRQKEGRVDVKDVLRRLAKAGLNHVLVEGGAQVSATLLRAGLADELALFLAPKLVGGDGLSWTAPLGVTRMARALALEDVRVEPVGADWLLRARLVPPTRSAPRSSGQGKGS